MGHTLKGLEQATACGHPHTFFVSESYTYTTFFWKDVCFYHSIKLMTPIPLLICLLSLLTYKKRRSSKVILPSKHGFEHWIRYVLDSWRRSWAGWVVAKPTQSNPTHDSFCKGYTTLLSAQGGAHAHWPLDSFTLTKKRPKIGVELPPPPPPRKLKKKMNGEPSP